MKRSGPSLMTAIYKALSNDGMINARVSDGGVMNHVLAGRPFPWLLIDTIDSRDLLGPTDGIEEHVVRLSAHAHAEGASLVMAIADAAVTALVGNASSMSLAGARLVSAEHLGTTVRLLREGREREAEIRLRFITE